MSRPADVPEPDPGQALHAVRIGHLGPAVTLVHGFTQTHVSWRPVATDLRDDHVVTAVDCPGHGGSAGIATDLSAGAALLGMAGSGGATATATGAPSVYVGYSMGGRLALRLALDRPDLVAGLVLLGATAGIDDAAERADRRAADAALAHRIEHDGVDPFLRTWLAQPLFAGLEPAPDDLAARKANSPAGLASSLRLAGTGTMDPPWWPELGACTVPTLVVAGEHDAIRVHVHHDERAAAFTALGLGLATGRPAIVLTTSGTAAVELHPAIVEAHQARVPLLAVTADRPPELFDVGAPQTVDQTHLFGSAVRWFAEPGPPVPAATGSWRSLAARAVIETTDGAGGPGPVHLNLGFREPLVGRAGPLPEGRPEGRPWHAAGARRVAMDRAGTEQLTAVLDVDRGVVVAGAGGGDPAAILALAGATGWPVLADPRSGCRTDHPSVVAHADALLRHPATAAALRPDAVLRLGAPPASKVLGQWLAASGARQVAVDGAEGWPDPDRTAEVVLHADPTAAVTALARLVGRPASEAWSGAWAAAEVAASDAIDASLADHAEITEPAVARTVSAGLRPGASLVVSSSMPVRDVEWFGGRAPGVRVLANRGANGIDGVVSTAVGVALASRGSGEATVVLIGDVALLHDSNALLGIAARGIDLTIVVVDNDGGGIFSFLPQAGALDVDRFEQLFGTPHGVDLSLLAAAHGLVTIEPAAAADVGDAVAASVAAGGVRLVRVRTERGANVAVHDELHAAVAAALDRR